MWREEVNAQENVNKDPSVLSAAFPKSVVGVNRKGLCVNPVRERRSKRRHGSVALLFLAVCASLDFPCLAMKRLP